MQRIFLFRRSFLLGVAAITFTFGAAGFAVVPTSVSAVECVNGYTSANRVPADSGAAYNVFSITTPRESVVKISCDANTLTVGSNLPTQYIYKTAQIFKNGSWQPITLTSPNALVQTNWFPATASFNLASQFTADEIRHKGVSAAAYICSWVSSAWKCGCTDGTCAAPKWQMQTTATTTATTTQLSKRGMWVWNTRHVITDPARLQYFVNEARRAGVTDAYLFLNKNDYINYPTQLHTALNLLQQNGIDAWGMDGWREYFNDVPGGGPSGLWQALNRMIAFNTATLPGNAKFVGFHSDMEPQDGQGNSEAGVPYPIHFHEGLQDSRLNTTQAANRQNLMADWLTITKTLATTTHNAGLLFGMAAPSWVDAYGDEPYPPEPIKALYAGVTKPVLNHFADIMNNPGDQYVVMSYNTDPANAANRVIGEAQYLSSLPAANRPRLMASVETVVGVAPGAPTSYGDSATKNNRTAVLADMQRISILLGGYSAFGGMAIHQWENGWSKIATTSTALLAPTAALPALPVAGPVAPPSPPGDINVAQTATITASNTVGGSTSMINDGNFTNAWVGGPVTQSVTLNFGSIQTISRINLVVEQSPAGNSTHKVYISSTGAVGSWVLWKTFTGSTAAGQVLTYQPTSPTANVRYIKVETSSSSSWVAWREIEVYATPPPPPSDTVAPTVPTGLAATFSNTTSGTIAWNASTDSFGVSGYEIARNNVQVGTTTTLTYTDTGLTANTSYPYKVRAYDAAGNRSAWSSVTSLTTLAVTPPPSDTTAPTIPTGVRVVTSTATSGTIAWNASTDSVGVTGYEVWQNGIMVAQTTALTFTSNTLYGDRWYSYTVAAFDAAGNRSGRQSVGTGLRTAPWPAGTFATGINIKTIPTLSTQVRATPSLTGALLPAKPANSLGVLVAGGPVVADAITWWKVDFNTGSDGWVKQDYIVPASLGY